MTLMHRKIRFVPPKKKKTIDVEQKMKTEEAFNPKIRANNLVKNNKLPTKASSSNIQKLPKQIKASINVELKHERANNKLFKTSQNKSKNIFIYPKLNIYPVQDGVCLYKKISLDNF